MHTIFLLVSGTRESEGFFVHLTDVLKEGLGQYFSGRPELNVIAEPGRQRERGVVGDKRVKVAGGWLERVKVA